MKTTVRQQVFDLFVQGDSLERLTQQVFDPCLKNAYWIVTANPEILLEAKRNPAYRAALQQADTLCVDGFGLWFGLRLIGCPVERVTGAVLAERLIEEATERSLCVGFIGGGAGIAEQAAQYWRKRFPGLRVVAEQGGRIAPDGTGDAAEEESVHRLMLEAPDVLFVAFGGGSKQESWIARRSGNFPSLKCVVGIGGVFDVWTGRLKRPPQLLQRVGLEWAWRVLQEPRRIGRILRATVVFPVLFVLDQLKQPGTPRKQMLYIFSLGFRILFFFFILFPALVRYFQAIFTWGIRVYSWSWSDLLIPIVIGVVLYPVIRFVERFYRQERSP